jgi:hypothetical protein
MAFRIKRNDLARSIKHQLFYVAEDGAVQADVDAAHAVLATKLAAAGTRVSMILKTKGALDTAPAKVNAAAVVVDANSRTVRYDWQVGDTNTSGTYEGEWEVIGADGRPETVPADSYFDVVIYDDKDRDGI